MTLQAAQKPPAAAGDGNKSLYGGKGTRRITVHDIAAAKARGEK
ncbi:3-methyl-2-oxobutanoate hydroxymethyltransferase, partial [Streptomyces sp. WAC02707]